MNISDDFKQELKLRIHIEDVIGEYVKLKRSGRGLMGLCPFHGEKTPSFSVSPDLGIYHCFGCQEGGDVIQFIRKIENLDYVDAVKLLAQKAGMTIPENSFDQGSYRLRQRIYEANRETARFYVKALYTPEGKEALNYLLERKLTPKTITHFGLGYSPKSRFALVNHLKSKGFSSTEMIQANLANQSQKGYPYDRFTDRVMFPIIDLQKRVIAFGGRIMSDIKPKYLNTSDTPVFSKSRNLFALQFAKNEAHGQLILVEGYMDVIALHQAGFQNAVATLGTALTKEQATLLKRYCDEIVICYDADRAGQTATARAIDILRPTGLNIKILTVPDGKDPDEFIKSHGDQGAARFRMLLEKCGNDIDYRMNKLRSNYDMDVTLQRVSFLTEAAKLLSTLDNSIERDVYISKLSEELNVDKNAIKQQVDKSMRRQARDSIQKLQKDIQRDLISGSKQRSPSEQGFSLRLVSTEEALVAILFTDPDIALELFRTTSPELFQSDFHQRIFRLMKSRADEGLEFGITDISDSLTDQEMNRLSGILSSHPREDDPKAAVKAYLEILREEKEKLTPEEIAKADDETLLEQIRRLRNKKQ